MNSSDVGVRRAGRLAGPRPARRHVVAGACCSRWSRRTSRSPRSRSSCTARRRTARSTCIAIPSHFFRFWLWLTTGMVTKEWVAIHRKHHAKCETDDDPHSPQTRGIKTVLLTGSELYRAEAKNQETLAKFGHDTPDDWIERNLYTPLQLAGRRRDADHRPDAVRRHRRRRSGRCRCCGSRSPPPASSTASATGGAIATSRRPTRQHQRLAVGHHHRRRGAAQQPPHLPDVGQAVGQAVRVRHRLGLHPRPRDARPGQGAQDAAAC